MTPTSDAFSVPFGCGNLIVQHYLSPTWDLPLQDRFRVAYVSQNEENELHSISDLTGLAQRLGTDLSTVASKDLEALASLVLVLSKKRIWGPLRENVVEKLVACFHFDPTRMHPHLNGKVLIFLDYTRLFPNITLFECSFDLATGEFSEKMVLDAPWP